MVYPWHLYLLSFLYVVAGILHFVKPNTYLKIMPNYLPNPKLLVALSGIFEIALGICLCISTLKSIAIYGIIAMLLVFLLVHFYMLKNEKNGAGVPKWILILRIPIQFILMYWAYFYINI
ncbi:MauE/DoxX family redox-associated membrane protein [uncultured Formosa sp.]|uniref:DoxX family protein n=1 Tax=uncultured Formosa sp. TaxID=255435 RepID=UPI002607A4F6|nr:MauE/DoxX family redox-associated membrane protein [uncultured Formosa sp.]